MSGIVGQPNQTGSGKIGPPTGTVVQTAIVHPGSSGTLTSSGSTNVLFGHVGVMPTITAGNSVLITCTFQCNTGNADNSGGFVYLMRGEWNTTAYTTITNHVDNLAMTQNDAGLTAIPNHNAANCHVYTTKAHHHYWMYTLQFWDRKVVSSSDATTQSTATNPRYCLGVVSHMTLGSTNIAILGPSFYPVTYLMQEIAA